MQQTVQSISVGNSDLKKLKTADFGCNLFYNILSKLCSPKASPELFFNFLLKGKLDKTS